MLARKHTLLLGHSKISVVSSVASLQLDAAVVWGQIRARLGVVVKMQVGDQSNVGVY